MASVGNMRSLATFKKNQPIQAGAGQKDNYVTLFSVYGELNKNIGSRRLDAGEVVISSSHRFRCRFANELNAGLDKKCKVVINNITYTIDGWQREDERNFYYNFQLNETV